MVLPKQLGQSAQQQLAPAEELAPAEKLAGAGEPKAEGHHHEAGGQGVVDQRVVDQNTLLQKRAAIACLAYLQFTKLMINNFLTSEGQ